MTRVTIDSVQISVFIMSKHVAKANRFLTGTWQLFVHLENVSVAGKCTLKIPARCYSSSGIGRSFECEFEEKVVRI